MILYLLKASVLMTLFLIIYRLFLAKINTFQFNRFYLLLSLVFSLTAPLVILPVSLVKIPNISEKFEKIFEPDQVHFENSVEFTIPETLTKNSSEAKAYNQSSSAHSYSFINKSTFLKLIYFTVTFGFFMSFLWKLFGLFRLIQSSQLVKEEGLIYVLLNKETLPFVFLNYFFVSKKIYEEKTLEKEIQIHELAHIKQKHSLDILFVEILKIVFWFNPTIWFYKKAMQLNHEYLADKAVIDYFNNEISYQILLLSKVSLKTVAFSMSSSVNYSITKNRLKMMSTKTDKVKSTFLKSFAMATSMIALLGFTSSVQSLQISPMMNLSSEKYESIIEGALKNDDPYVLELKNLDIPNLKSAYDQLSEEERENVSEFPFLTAETLPKLMELQSSSEKIHVEFRFKRPVSKNSIKAEVWEYWKEGKKVNYEVDEEEIGSEIGDYTKDDFALYQVIETQAKGFLKKPEYLVKLTTNEYYEKKHVQVQRELYTIYAEYENGDQLDVFYFMKNVSFTVSSKNSEVKPSFSEGLEELILKGILGHEEKEYKPGPHHIKGLSIPVSLKRNGEARSINIFKESESKSNF